MSLVCAEIKNIIDDIKYIGKLSDFTPRIQGSRGLPNTV